MKMIAVLVVALSMMVSLSIDAAGKEPLTRLEQLMLQKGKVITMESYPIGTLKGIYVGLLTYKKERELPRTTVSALVLSDVQSPNRRYGLEVSLTDRARVIERADDFYVDFDEMEALSEALSYMITLAEDWAFSMKNARVMFQTKGELGIGFRQEGIKQIVFLKDAGEHDWVNVTLEVDSLHHLKRFVDDGLRLLKSLMAEADVKS